MFAREKYKATIQGVWKKCALSKLIVKKKINKKYMVMKRYRSKTSNKKKMLKMKL